MSSYNTTVASTDITDLALIERIRSSNQEALALLMEKYATALYPLARRILTQCGTAEDAEELLSDAFLYVWTNAGTYNPERGAVKSWLSWVVVAHALQRRRGLLRFQNLNNVLERQPTLRSTEQGDSEEQIAAAELIHPALTALQNTSPADADIIARRFLQQSTPSEIARDLGISPNLARVRLHRAMKKLRELMILSGGTVEVPRG